MVCEKLWGMTIGKRLFSIRVVRADGGRIGLGQSVGRNLLRVVDGFPYVLPYLVGFLASRTSGERLRLGDMAAGTRVVGRERDPA
ncbi:MAG TPA: RDD family protein [Gaiellales bacterium]